jgi:diguanylate cyclase (GGDEF)-like protein
VRLIDRNDTSLAIALIASVLVIFQKPLHLLVDAARAVELQYNIDLLPGLTVLVGTFGFHQYRKRQQARAAASAASSEASLARARSIELERLVAFGHALGSALAPSAMRQVFWRHMPAFAGDRELWMLTRKPDGWEPAFRDATAPAQRSSESLEAIATSALMESAGGTMDGNGRLVGDDLCFPMMVGDIAVGVVGIRHGAMVADSERHAMSAAAALLAIAIRNNQLIAETRENSIRDGLTGCFNRTYAIEALGAELRRAKRTREPLAVLMFDIDRFKDVNDKFGHLAGDEVLTTVGARLETMLRASDVKCRYGGDEFLVILPDTDLAGAEHVAASIVDDLANMRIAFGDAVISPTISLGVATARPAELDCTTVIADADEALYRAKRAGRNRYAAGRLAPAV